MKIVSKILWTIVFFIFISFTIKNVEYVTLHYFFGYQQEAPLIIWLLAFFSGGAILGILAMVPMVFRHKRDISKHKKTIAEIEKEKLAAQRASTEAPQPDGVRNI
ncbi:LapA family protein [Undibacterium sp. Jales W-56]|uniref:LapA family protein n=1 Tax=Undibacterium sp. Jales W-56 TaxID=2897325 RepID=UPI0021D3CB1F|nr:LapA family protein [Undibacterium sp. Jales W-56]MCU6432680.1 LapA family protein [Undibacterium sp. Jales W-56]